MATPFHKSIICPTLFGRSTELAVIESRLQVAAGGQGGVVLLSGEAGIGNFWVALVAIWCASVFRDMQEPVFRAWQVQRIDPALRATVLSIDGQVNALGQIAGDPALGAIGNISLRAALIVAGMALSPALLLLLRARRQATVALAPEETTAMVAVPLEEASIVD
jgi:hypothetical protein